MFCSFRAAVTAARRHGDLYFAALLSDTAKQLGKFTCHSDITDYHSEYRQIRQYLERCLPGYAALFPKDDLWTLYEDWQTKTRQVEGIERDLAGILVKTPYVLLLSHPGIHVVSASELAGEMGPIEHDAHAKAISGRAGLFPSRYQSDEVDRADRPLARFRNARLRAASPTARQGPSSKWSAAGGCTATPAAWIASTCSTSWRGFIKSTARRPTRFSAISKRPPPRFRDPSTPPKPPPCNRPAIALGAAAGLGRKPSARSWWPCRRGSGWVGYNPVSRLQVPTRRSPTRAPDNAVVPMGSATRSSRRSAPRAPSPSKSMALRRGLQRRIRQGGARGASDSPGWRTQPESTDRDRSRRTPAS